MKLNRHFRRVPRGGFEAGVQVDGRAWRWKSISAKSVDVARKKAVPAFALLLDQAAAEHEEIAQSFLNTAKALRAEAEAVRAGQPIPELETP